jgi:CRP-like cAMP-binding protein
VLVHRDGADIAHLGSGEHFGERGLLDRAPRNASVTTEGESTLLRIDGDVLLSELAASPTLFSALDRSDPLVTVAAPPSDSGLVDDTTWSPT